MQLSAYCRSVLEELFPADEVRRGRPSSKRKYSRYGDPGADIPRAVHAIGGTETDRRLLQEVAYEWRRPRRMQRGRAERLRQLLKKMDHRADSLVKAIIEAEHARRYLEEVNLSAAWAANASRAEASKLCREYVVVAQAVEEFKNWADTCGHDSATIDLCVRRMLGPLVASKRTRGLMLGWEDLTLKRQCQFLKFSIEREKLMLGPVPALSHKGIAYSSPLAAALGKYIAIK